MMMSSKVIISLLLSFSVCLTYGQDRRTGNIAYEREGQGYRVRVDIPQPRTIPGARKAFDEYLIEFGDGTHSFEESPLHVYPPGKHIIRTSIINNYDDGKPPKIPQRMIEVDQTQSDARQQPGTTMIDEEPLEFVVFQDPMPEEEVVCILTYRNTTQVTVSGSIDLYFNEHIYGSSHFNFVEARLHHGESAVPDDLLTDHSMWSQDRTMADVVGIYDVLAMDSGIDRQTLLAEFERQKRWQFGNLQPGEERSMYVSLMATSVMLRDTNATIRLAATLESDDGRIQKVKLTHKQIVTSHDPNRMSVRPRKMHYARRISSPIEYYVKFQNHGEGPARQISVECNLSENIDMQSLRILDMYPPCPICPDNNVTFGCLDTTWKEEGVVFTFRNIYLPGREQDLTRKDSTKGFVRFEVTPGEKLRKVPFNARSEIVFDKNEPIRTNGAKMRFRTDLRTGLIGGIHNKRPEGADASDIGVFAGTVLSPYKPYRFYYQAELMPVYSSHEIRDLNSGAVLYNLRQVHVDIVPLQVRKNLASFVGVGAGVHLSALVYSQQVENGVNSDARWFEDIAPSVFADINLGSVRSGLSAGARYYKAIDGAEDFWGLYLVVRR